MHQDHEYLEQAQPCFDALHRRRVFASAPAWVDTKIHEMIEVSIKIEDPWGHTASSVYSACMNQVLSLMFL